MAGSSVFAGSGIQGNHPPYKSSGGNFYCVVITANVISPTLDVYKAIDPTSSWTVQDAADNPVLISGTYLGYQTVQEGDVIHIVAWQTSDIIHYYTFDMSSDQWVEDEQALQTSNTVVNPWVGIARRTSPAATIICYAGDPDSVMGDTKQRVDYAIRPDSSGTWDTVDAALDAGGDVFYGQPNCIEGTNSQIHFVWQRQIDTTKGDPIAWESSQGRTLDSSDDSLSTTDDSTADSSNQLLGGTNLVTYDDSGTQRVIANFLVGSNLWTAQGTEDGSDDLVLVATGVSEALTNAPRFANEHPFISMAALDADIHGLYAGGGVVGLDLDLHYITSTDDGASWTDTEETDALTVNFVSANIYVRGTNTVLAYLYDSAGTQYYDEKILVAGVFLPFYPNKQNTLLRM